VPALLHEPIAVDKDNIVSTIIKDGYHKMEDVYQGVPKDQWPAAPQAGRRKDETGASLVAAFALVISALLWKGV